MIRKKYLRALSVGIALCTACTSMFSCSKTASKSYFDMTYEELSEYVTLGEYKNLDVTLNYYAVEDYEVKQVIEADFADYIEEVNITQREIRDGDIVTIDFTATIDGEEFEGNSAEGYVLEIGSHSFEYAENALLGAYLGDTVTFEGTYEEGDDVDESFIGKTAVFAATVTNITAITMPKMTNDLVYQVTGYTSYDEYIEGLRTEMRTYYDDLAMTAAQTELWVQVCTNSTFIKYPKDKFEKAKQSYYDYYEDIAAEYGVTVDEMLADYLGISKTTYEEKANEHAANVVYEDIVLFLIAKKENITISDEDYRVKAQEYVDDLIRQSLEEEDSSTSTYNDFLANYDIYSSSESEEKESMITSVAQLEAVYGKDYVRQVVLYELVLEFLFDNANVTYSEYYPAEDK